jgi:hypothetical protein
MLVAVAVSAFLAKVPMARHAGAEALAVLTGVLVMRGTPVVLPGFMVAQAAPVVFSAVSVRAAVPVGVAQSVSSGPVQPDLFHRQTPAIFNLKIT